MKQPKQTTVLVRGAGDLATGTIVRLKNCGFNVIALEAEKPLVIRRTVAFAQAVFFGTVEVEGITARHVSDVAQALDCMAHGDVPVLVDEKADAIAAIEPDVVIDAILAKKNLGTHKAMAPVVIALGPGFSAGADCHAVIETNRGHNLGRVILQGQPEPNTGTPGIIAGYGKERVVRAPAAGTVAHNSVIGDVVKAEDVIAFICHGAGKTSVHSPLDGVVRGLIAEGLNVPEGLKMADVDPRSIVANCFTVSDKARAIGGGVLEAILVLQQA